MTTVSELVDKGDIPEERKDNVKKVLHDLGYAASRAVGKAFLKITEKHMTDAGMMIADANAVLAEVEPLQGSHLFKFKWHMAVQEVLGFSCINDSRNGLLLAKPIEEAFDAVGFLCFIPGEDGEHRVHLLDASLCNVKLTDVKAYPWLKPPGQEKMAKENKQQDIIKDVTQALKESFGDIPTFAALQGKQLQFEGDLRPFKCCLAFQASESRHSALSQGRISPSAIPEIDASAWSHNSYLERIKDYLADPEFQYQVGHIDRLDSISDSILGKLDDSG